MPNPMMRRVNWSITTSTQCVRRLSDSKRNRSLLYKLSLAWPRKVSQDGPPDPDGRLCFPRIWRTTSLSISTPKVKVICWASRGQPQVGLRRFISMTASINSLAGPCEPGRCLRRTKTTGGTFVYAAPLWRCSRVEGLQNDGGTENACRTQEQRTQADDDPIPGT